MAFLGYKQINPRKYIYKILKLLLTVYSIYFSASQPLMAKAVRGGALKPNDISFSSEDGNFETEIIFQRDGIFNARRFTYKLKVKGSEDPVFFEKYIYFCDSKKVVQEADISKKTEIYQNKIELNDNDYIFTSANVSDLDRLPLSFAIRNKFQSDLLGANLERSCKLPPKKIEDEFIFTDSETKGEVYAISTSQISIANHLRSVWVSGYSLRKEVNYFAGSNEKIEIKILTMERVSII